MNSLPQVTIVQPAANLPSETFIASHARRLPLATRVIHSTPPVLEADPLPPPRGKNYDDLYRELLKRSQAQVVLAEFGHMGLLVLPACRALDLPLVVHFHGWDLSVKTPLLMLSINPQLFEYASALVVVSEPMRQTLLSLGCPQHKIHLSPCGVDTHFFKPSQPSQQGPDFLCVGRFVEKKGHAYTLRAFAKVRAQVPEARLRLVGDGPLLAQSRALAFALGLTGAVEFMGVLGPEAVRAELRRSRCVVLPSCRAADGDAEGAPVVLMEAGACGLPVVATRHGGIPTIVRDQVSGFLVDERDEQALADAMIQLAREPLLADQMGGAGRVHIETHFELESSLSKLAAILTRPFNGEAKPRGNFA